MYSNVQVFEFIHKKIPGKLFCSIEVDFKCWVSHCNKCVGVELKEIKYFDKFIAYVTLNICDEEKLKSIIWLIFFWSAPKL